MRDVYTLDEKGFYTHVGMKPKVTAVEFLFCKDLVEFFEKPFLKFTVSGKTYGMAFEHHQGSSKEFIQEAYATKHDWTPVANPKAVTTCLIYDWDYLYDSEANDWMIPAWAGIAVCGPNDTFSRKEGRFIAAKRALEHFGLRLADDKIHVMVDRGPSYPKNKLININLAPRNGGESVQQRLETIQSVYNMGLTDIIGKLNANGVFDEYECVEAGLLKDGDYYVAVGSLNIYLAGAAEEAEGIHYRIRLRKLTPSEKASGPLTAEELENLRLFLDNLVYSGQEFVGVSPQEIYRWFIGLGFINKS